MLRIFSPGPIGKTIVGFGEIMPPTFTFQARLGQFFRGIFAHGNY